MVLSYIKLVTVITNRQPRKRSRLLWPGASQFRIYHHWMLAQLSTTCSNLLKLFKWGINSYSRPPPAMENGVWHGGSNWLVALPPSCAEPPGRLVLSINRCSFSRESTLQPSACEATILTMRFGLLVWTRA